MQTIGEHISYLKGLSEGLGVSGGQSVEAKLIDGILDILAMMAEDLDYLAEEFEDFREYIEAIDDDLADLEDDVYEYDEENEWEDALLPGDEDDLDDDI